MGHGSERLELVRAVLLLPLFAALGAGCVDRLEPCAGRSVSAGETLECPMPDWTDRAFELQIPDDWDGQAPLPLILALHGGGGNKRSAARVTCPDGEEEDAACLSRVARDAGFAVLLPDGTGTRPTRNLRTWNAGGGTDGWNCTSGGACASKVDDVRYFRELLEEVRRIVPIDSRRVFVTGLSNGAAMSHRLACEMSGEIAAIVAVGGTNQFAAAGGACDASVPVLQIHGTEDSCWTYEQSSRSCIGTDKGTKSGVDSSMERWAKVNGCGSQRTEEALPDKAPSDGTRSYRVSWNDCAASLQLIRIEGGGHTWPDGYAYLDMVGRVPRDFGSEVIVSFFLDHPKP